jgi:hypothetical protein
MKPHLVYPLCIVLMLVPVHGLCQNSASADSTDCVSLVGVSLGISDFHQKDKYLSPFVFNGMTLASRISWRMEDAMSRHGVDAFFSRGSLDSDVQPRNVTQTLAYLSCYGVHPIGTWDYAGNPLQLLVGAGLSSFVANTDFNAIDRTYNVVATDQSWYWSHSLNAVVACAYRLDGGRDLSVQVTAPVLRLVSRPENGHWLSTSNLDVSKNFLRAATKGKIEYLWDDLVLFGEIEYRHQISSHFGLRGTYWFGYMSSGKPDAMLSMGMYANHFLVGLDWVF